MPREELFVASTLWLLLMSAFGAHAAQELKGKGDSRRETHLNVLIVDIPFLGHLLPVSALGEELVRRGHNVTVCMSLIRKSDIQVKTVERAGMNLWSAGDDIFDPEMMKKGAKKASNQTFLGSIFSRDSSENDPFWKMINRLNKLLNNSQIEVFDIIIVDWLLSPVVACVSKNFGVPFIVVSPGLMWHTSLLPTWPFPLLGLSFNPEMTFSQRLLSTVYKPVLSYFLRSIYDTSMPALQCGATLNYIVEPFGHYVPLFVTSAIGFEYPRTISPLTSYVGPLLSKNPEPLQPELSNWLKKRPLKSVVYVSMGTVIYLTKEMGEAFLKGVLDSGLDLVWSLKEENRDILDGLDVDSDRVYLTKWAPQLSVFKHKAIGVAILHGGLGGLQEALSNSVPVIVVPVTNDHGDDAARVEYFGLGVSISPNDLNASILTESLLKITSTDSYHQAIARLKKMYSFAGGVDKAAELVEHYSTVGYDHLVPAYAKYEWSWIVYYNVDVKALLVSILCLFSYLMVKCCRCCCSYCCRKASSTKAKKD